MATNLQDRVPEAVSQPGKDNVVRWLMLSAAGLSIGSLLYFYSQGVILAYIDSVSHMEISRRVIGSPTAGFAQLGSVWLPMPHLLSLPFVWIDSLYFSGLAGSFVSMAAYVLTSLLIYKIIVDLTDHQLAGVVGALVFMLNPNVLYMQSTPMTELLLFACMAGMVYGVQRWIGTGHYGYLLGGSLAGLAGCFTRYEAWVLYFALGGVVALMVWRQGQLRTRLVGTVVAYSVFGGVLAIAGWLLWNWAIFGDPLEFYRGEYAKPSLWVDRNELTHGNLWASIKTYYYAVVDNLWLPVAVLMIVGLVGMLFRERLAPRTWPLLSMFVLFPFFVWTLYDGQRPLHVEEVEQGLYNIRFGLLMAIPAAVLVGYLASLLAGFKLFEWAYAAVVAVIVAGIMVLSFITPNRILTLKEPAGVLNAQFRQVSDTTGEYLARHYDGGLILMQSFGNELVLPDARITTDDNIYEGSYHLWESALQDPAGNDVRWIIMRHPGDTDQADRVFTSLYGGDALDSYRLVYSNSTYYVYKEVQ